MSPPTVKAKREEPLQIVWPEGEEEEDDDDKDEKDEKDEAPAPAADEKAKSDSGTWQSRDRGRGHEGYARLALAFARCFGLATGFFFALTAFAAFAARGAGFVA